MTSVGASGKSVRAQAVRWTRRSAVPAHGVKSTSRPIGVSTSFAMTTPARSAIPTARASESQRKPIVERPDARPRALRRERLRPAWSSGVRDGDARGNAAPDPIMLLGLEGPAENRRKRFDRSFEILDAHLDVVDGDLRERRVHVGKPCSTSSKVSRETGSGSSCA